MLIDKHLVAYHDQHKGNSAVKMGKWLCQARHLNKKEGKDGFYFSRLLLRNVADHTEEACQPIIVK